jgi:hypothetical protein
MTRRRHADTVRVMASAPEQDPAGDPETPRVFRELRKRNERHQRERRRRLERLIEAKRQHRRRPKT